jgi:hypothetical protein
MSGQVKDSFAPGKRRSVIIQAEFRIVPHQGSYIPVCQKGESSHFKKIQSGVLKAVSGDARPLPIGEIRERDLQVHGGDLPVSDIEVISARCQRSDQNRPYGSGNYPKDTDCQTSEKVNEI